MTRTVRTGLIGCGGIARSHVAALSALPTSELVACCDVDEGRAREFAGKHGVPRVYTDATEMLRSGAVEAVCVCTPHPIHGPLVVAAAEAGVHSLVEKPITIDLGVADRMIEATRKAGVRFGVIFQRRFWPASQRVRTAIDEGRLGTLTLGECVARLWRSPEYFGSAPWRGTWATEGGGALMNQAVHFVDLLQWYMGPAVEVFGRWATLRHSDVIDVEDTTVATVVFANGALGVIEAATTFSPPFGFRVAVHGTSGAAVGIEESPEGRQGVNDIWTVPGQETLREGWLEKDRAHPGFPSFHQLQIQDFLDAVLDGRDPAVTGEEARRSLEIILAIYRSQETRHPVSLPMATETTAAGS